MTKERRTRTEPFINAKGYLVPGKVIKPNPCNNFN
jgi:hypothetical protein